MSLQEAAQLEQQLEDTGTLSLTQSEAQGLFDYRARKLVRMSGKRALKRIRSGKCGPNLAWAELAVFSALLK
jgi:hypothetical protein